jgi:tRNA-2-methylthio-N6-dimethylallyladenosine synthase
VTRRYLVRTFGCQMNEHDSERIAGLLDADGMEPTDNIDDADVVVLNTCCIRENADNKLYGALGILKPLKEQRPDMRIMVSGCLAQMDRDTVRQRAPHVDVVFGTHNVHRAVELLHTAEATGPVVEIWDAMVDTEDASFPSALPAHREVDWAGWVTIQVGCDNSCAFCIVPSVRGVEASRTFGDIVAEVTALAADGVSEVTLLGQNVNSYGRDLTTRLRSDDSSAAEMINVAGHLWTADDRRRPRPLFADLLRSVAAVPGIRRVRYTSPHPKDLRPETIEAMATTPEVCPHLHLPLQSGSDRILVAMHRGYTAERYLERLAAARAAVDDLAVTTDIIVGFPGETDDDFEQTLEVAATAQYDSAYTFQFSARPGTEASTMTDHFVAPEVVAERFARLRVVVERSALMRHEARIGRTEDVLVEGPSRKDPAMLTGRTAQSKLIHFASDAPLRAGSYARVTVTGAAPHHLRGELVEVVASARHRTRIPVTSG